MFLSKLEFLMKRKKINNLKELSQLSGVPYTTLRGFYDKGTKGIRTNTLKKLTDFFGCTIDYLVNDNIPESHLLHLSGITESDYQKMINELKKDMKNDFLDISNLSEEEKANIIHIVELLEKDK